MAFTVPAFNLTCNVYTGPWLAKVLRVPGLACNIQGGRRVHVASGGLFAPGVELNNVGPTFLLVPLGSDLRDAAIASTPDIVEAPAGSSRWYVVAFVDDVGKGFANEFRYAELAKISDVIDPVEFLGATWPLPMP